MWPDGFPIDDYVRQARRRRRLSQRDFAQAVGVGTATISRIESGSCSPTVALADRVLSAGGLILVAVEPAGDDGVRFVPPLTELNDDCRDGADRRYPAHLDLVVDPFENEWWAASTDWPGRRRRSAGTRRCAASANRSLGRRSVTTDRLHSGLRHC